MKEIEIAGRKIGGNYSPYIIAELSANHNGRLEKAIEVISQAKQSGADAVKLQTYTADTMTIDCDNEEFCIHGGLWDGYKLYELYKWAETPFDWHRQLFDYARKIGITVFSTPFDETAVDLLEDLNVPAYKVASFEVVDLPLIKYIAATGKPMIISTGMADEQEIQEAVDTARENGCDDLVLLHCVSAYPAPEEQMNLRTLPDIAQRFNTVVGLSDHTLGTTVSIASIALGASVIEKHVTLSRDDKGPDSAFSLEPNEFKALCEEAKLVWKALGKVGYKRQSAEENNVKFRRSLYFVTDLSAGEIIQPQHIRRIRPGYGLAPKYYEQVLGRKLVADIKRGTAVSWEQFDD